MAWLELRTRNQMKTSVAFDCHILRRFQSVLKLLFVIVVIIGTGNTNMAAARTTGYERKQQEANDGEKKIVLKYNTTEELPVGTVVGDMIADSGYLRSTSRERALQFEIVSGGVGDQFWINPTTGVILVGGANENKRAPLDRDRICPRGDVIRCVVYFDVTVVGQEFFQMYGIEVTIADINDNAPTFESDTLKSGQRASAPLAVVSVPENSPVGSKFILPSAYDLDISDSLRYEYDVINGSFGDVTVQTTHIDQAEVGGVGGSTDDVHLVVSSALDREVTPFYSLVVRAVDKAARTGLIEVHVIVEDVNDNAPVFEQTVYDVTLNEDAAPATLVTRVSAVDEDEGANAAVRYSLVTRGGSGTVDAAMFSLDAVTGELTLTGHLNYRISPEHRLTVSAMDGGAGAVPAYATVMIRVKDVNDNPPTIRVKTTTLTVVENEPPGTVVGHVTVDDVDTGSGGTVNCGLTPSISSAVDFQLSQLFAGPPVVYKITTTTSFDRELHEAYRVVVTCHDLGEPVSMTSSLELIVRITDTNDNEPRFEPENYSVTIKENNTRDMFVVRVSAYDSDAGENATVRYSISVGEKGEEGREGARDRARWLSVDPVTGVVSAINVYDFEEKNEFVFSVIATDRGRPLPRSSTATILLKVTDINDETPVFSQTSYSFGTFENQPNGTEIGTLTASDRDMAPFDEFTFSLDIIRPASGYSGLFQIDPQTGLIRITRILDREQYAIHYLTATVTNVAYPYHSSSVPVTVYVADRNDNAPMIEFPNHYNHTLYLSQYAPVGHSFTRIIATDADVGSNARLEYSIAKGNDDNFFDINPTNGAISIKRSLLSAALSQSTAGSELSDSNEIRRYTISIVVRDGAGGAATLGSSSSDTEKSATADLDIVIDRTPFHTVLHPNAERNFSSSFSFSFPYHRELIVIISCVTGVLVVALITAIICIRKRPTTTMTTSNKKYTARPSNVYHVRDAAAAAGSRTVGAYCEGLYTEPGGRGREGMDMAWMEGTEGEYNHHCWLTSNDEGVGMGKDGKREDAMPWIESTVKNAMVTSSGTPTRSCSQYSNVREYVPGHCTFNKDLQHQTGFNTIGGVGEGAGGRPMNNCLSSNLTSPRHKHSSDTGLTSTGCYDVINTTLPSAMTPRSRYDNRDVTAQHQVRLLLEMLKKGHEEEDKDGRRGDDEDDDDAASLRSCLDSGLGPSETDIDSLQTTYLPLFSRAKTDNLQTVAGRPVPTAVSVPVPPPSTPVRSTRAVQPPPTPRRTDTEEGESFLSAPLALPTSVIQNSA